MIATNETFTVEDGPPGFRKALLFNPPVYDAQYWARWSQPAGLLRIATFLRRKGYNIELIDCMETNAKGMVRKSRRKNENGNRIIVERDNIEKTMWHFGKPWSDVEKQLCEIRDGGNPPDEVWITSIMTYWWESTRDAAEMIRRILPNARIYVGGIYPTLAPEHANDNLNVDVVFKGELKEASNCPTDLSLYNTHPTYSILSTSRGCPWDCHYCAARALNGSPKMSFREPEDVLDEIKYKMEHFGIRHFGFYEDNALALKGHMQSILELILSEGLKLHLYAPEGFETRMLNVDLLRVMKKSGFRKIHLPFETLRFETNLGWGRRHASTASFDQALQAAIQAGFKPRTEEINAFVLFGLPDEKLEDIMDSVLYVHHEVGSVIPMLFTPVPGTQVYREHKDYLHKQMGWDLQNLNGKFLPFLEYNRNKNYPGLQASDYLDLESLMSVLNNGKFMSKAVDLCDRSPASRAFRNALQIGSNRAPALNELTSVD